jgi:DNA recombination protein RmuC
MEYGFLIIGLAVGALLGYFIAVSRNKQQAISGSTAGISEVDFNALRDQKNQLEGRLNSSLEEFQKIELQLNQERTSKEELIRELSEWKANHDNLLEKLNSQKEELETLQERFNKDFELLANKILEDKTKKFTDQNHQNLKQVLEPLNEKIKNFEKQVEEKYLKEAEGRSALAQQIKSLTDLNKQMSEDASNLTKALRGDSKIQGDWGELRLELILEKAGLNKGVHYTTQDTFRDEDGNLKKPDCIIHLPNDKHIIIDSKVSLTAYDAYFNSDSEEDRQKHLKNHILSINEHIRELGNRNYQNLYEINTPDYVLMYIPIEPAFSLALQTDQDIYLNALGRNIVLVTTSTLLATMSTVASIWQQEEQKKNVLEIARQGGALYDKFVNFVDDLVDVGTRMNSAKKAYDLAMNKLTDGKGNLIKRAEDIRKLGAKTSKQMSKPLIDRALTNIESDEQQDPETKFIEKENE